MAGEASVEGLVVLHVVLEDLEGEEDSVVVVVVPPGGRTTESRSQVLCDTKILCIFYSTLRILTCCYNNNANYTPTLQTINNLENVHLLQDSHHPVAGKI